jgi:hypothetical protein
MILPISRIRLKGKIKIKSPKEAVFQEVLKMKKIKIVIMDLIMKRKR